MKYSIAFMAAVAAVQASPVPQAVTAKISPSATAPSGCSPTYSGSFGIVAQAVTASSSTAAVSQINDGQVQAGQGAAVTQIKDGQVQAATATDVAGAAVTQINDGQVQAPTATRTMSNAVTQIADGQIQAMYVTPVTQISDGQVQAATATVAPVSQIADGQVQATTAAAAVTQIADGQVQADVSASPVTQISDGQVQAATATGPAVTQIADGQVQSGADFNDVAMVACNVDGALSLMLDNGVITDSKGRTGYIASNYQFQFDEPPQAGAIYTAGFSVCGNGSLALGGSTTFYQCLSGGFYNLYSKNTAAQCEEVTLDVVDFVDCSA